MSTSRFNSLPEGTRLTTVNSNTNLTVRSQKSLFDGAEAPVPGSMNDAALIRETLAHSIRKCNKSRAQIAEEISILSGQKVTEIHLNKFTAESRIDYRWPAELDRAFCAATGDNALLRVRVELAGYRMITPEEGDLLDLGREYLRQKRASEQVDLLEKRLQGVDL